MMIMSTIRTTFLLPLLAVLFVIIGNALGGRLGMIIALCPMPYYSEPAARTIASLFTTHPSTEEKIKRLTAMQ